MKKLLVLSFLTIPFFSLNANAGAGDAVVGWSCIAGSGVGVAAGVKIASKMDLGPAAGMPLIVGLGTAGCGVAAYTAEKVYENMTKEPEEAELKEEVSVE